MLLNELLWLLLMGPVSLGLGLVIKAEWLWLADGGWVWNGEEREWPPKHLNWVLVFDSGFSLCRKREQLCDAQWCHRWGFRWFWWKEQLGELTSVKVGPECVFGAAHLSTNFRVGDHRVRACCCHGDGRLTARCSLCIVGPSRSLARPPPVHSLPYLCNPHHECYQPNCTLKAMHLFTSNCQARRSFRNNNKLKVCSVRYK